jgi:small-conductance mechanosensitive channel
MQSAAVSEGSSLIRAYLRGLIPSFLDDQSFLDLRAWQWLGLVLAAVLALVLGVVFEKLALWVGHRLTALTSITWDDQVVASGRGPLKLLFFSALLYTGTGLLSLPPAAVAISELVCRSLLIVSISWFLLRFLRLSASVVESRVAAEPNPVRARGVRTQLTVLRSVFEIAVYFVAVALLLMQFDIVRNLGVSLLASAGIVGLVIGIAAQKSIGNLLAGIQLSITQPVRIGDHVVVEGEFGTVEEITVTYVVLRLWDLRRMVVPVVYFLEKPFQNWSRTSPDLLGVVTVQVDFSADVSAFRTELKRILENEGASLWDGRSQSLAVTDSADRTMTLRALVSAGSPERLWDLRALVREKLLGFLKVRPTWLPVTRSVVPASADVELADRDQRK